MWCWRSGVSIKASGSRFQTNLYPLLFGDSRYAERDPIGLTEILETAPVEQLQAYYERWYRPDLMAIVAVGQFDVEEIEAKITQHFAPPPEGEAYQERAAVADPTDKPSFDVPDNDTPIVDVFTDPEAPVTQVTLVRKFAPDTGQDLAAFRRGVVVDLAFRMLNARLFERGQQGRPALVVLGGRRRFVRRADRHPDLHDRHRAGRRRGWLRRLAGGNATRQPAWLYRGRG